MNCIGSPWPVLLNLTLNLYRVWRVWRVWPMVLPSWGASPNVSNSPWSEHSLAEHDRLTETVLHHNRPYLFIMVRQNSFLISVNCPTRFFQPPFFVINRWFLPLLPVKKA